MRVTIYVTDDEPAIRSAIVKRLSRRQHAVSGFESGEDLLRAVTQHVPDLILLDLKMPGMGGLDALRRIRPIAPQTLVVMLVFASAIAISFVPTALIWASPAVVNAIAKSVA